MNEPAPMAAVTAINAKTGQSLLPDRRHCTKAIKAAIRKEALVMALNGSAQNDGSVRSQ
jgi:hypothetical protein